MHAIDPRDAIHLASAASHGISVFITSRLKTTSRAFQAALPATVEEMGNVKPVNKKG